MRMVAANSCDIAIAGNWSHKWLVTFFGPSPTWTSGVHPSDEDRHQLKIVDTQCSVGGCSHTNVIQFNWYTFVQVGVALCVSVCLCLRSSIDQTILGPSHFVKFHIAFAQRAFNETVQKFAWLYLSSTWRNTWLTKCNTNSIAEVFSM